MEDKIKQAIAMGADLVPIADFPNAPSSWRIGFFYDGKPHAISETTYRNHGEAKGAIKRLYRRHNAHTGN